MRVTSEHMQETLKLLFLKFGFSKEKSKVLAKVFTNNTIDGIRSHGINRVPLFIKYVKNDIVKTDQEAEKMASFGNIERWDGNFGPGILNAITCTDRAIELAKNHGMGLVALRNNNHWMRGGAYGWQAAEAGCIGIMFTNTQPNMPPWGGVDSRIGNNPFVVSIPRKQGHIVLDMALSQFAFGKIHDYKLRGEKLPFQGGWDENNELSDDPEKILKNERGLPVGYWKGSALSIILDMLATLLSAGNSTYRISKYAYETGISQVFLCIDPEVFNDSGLQERLIEEIIQYTHDVPPIREGERTYYPGERTLETRKRNLTQGMDIDDDLWNGILETLAS